ncbi:MAG: hypothetical protein ABI999_12460 [Acidobacteriota bacterium]
MNTNQSKQSSKDYIKDEATSRKRVDRFFLRWERYRGYSTLILTAMCVGLYITARAYYGDADRTTQVEFFEDHSEQDTKSESQGQTKHAKQIFSGEGYNTAFRLRESGALLLALSLSAFEEFRVHGKFPQTADVILADLQRRSLLPPGTEIKNGALHSDLGELKLNYRMNPIALEVLSLPPAETYGPALLFRIPMPAGEANSMTYFRSSVPTNFTVPAPFSSPEQLVSAGWSIEHWQGDALPLDDSALRDLHENDAWLKSFDQGSK